MMDGRNIGEAAAGLMAAADDFAGCVIKLLFLVALLVFTILGLCLYIWLR